MVTFVEGIRMPVSTVSCEVDIGAQGPVVEALGRPEVTQETRLRVTSLALLQLLKSL